MKALASVAVALLLLLPGEAAGKAEAPGACGYPGVAVDGDARAVGVACVALTAVADYFERLGNPIEPQVRISFQDEVWITLEGTGADRLKVSGCYDPRIRTVRITDWRTGTRPDRRPWGLPLDEAMIRSVLVHELVHMAVIDLLGEGSAARLGGAWHEFVAYAIQLTLMPEAMRAQILARHLDLAPFSSPWEINQATYASDPDRFALRAFLHMQAHGGEALLRAILAGEVQTGMGETGHICR